MKEILWTKKEKKATLILIIVGVAVMGLIFGMKARSKWLHQEPRKEITHQERVEGEMIPLMERQAKLCNFENASSVDCMLYERDYYERKYGTQDYYYEETATTDTTETDTTGSNVINYDNTYTTDSIFTTTTTVSDGYFTDLGQSNHSVASLLKPMSELFDTMYIVYTDKNGNSSSKDAEVIENYYYGIITDDSLESFYENGIKAKYNSGSYYACIVNTDTNEYESLDGSIGYLAYGLNCITEDQLVESVKNNYSYEEIEEQFGVVLGEYTYDIDLDEEILDYEYSSFGEYIVSRTQDPYIAKLFNNNRVLVVARLDGNKIYIEKYGRADVNYYLLSEEDGLEYDEYHLFTGIYALR